MDQYHITGGRRLSGTLTVAGAKNAALPILAATLLSTKTCRIYNCPDLSDVRTMTEILKALGCKVVREGDAVSVDPAGACVSVIPDHLMREMRSSVFLMGPMLARFGQITFSRPGGCAIGSRPIDIHLSALRSMGAEMENMEDRILCSAPRLVGTELRFAVPSVGATENTMLAAVGAEGETVIYGGAKEPEIVDLQDFLNRCGARVCGAGTEQIRIVGTGSLHGGEHRVIPDRIEAGTFLCAAAITGGEIRLEQVRPEHMEAVLKILEKAGCEIRRELNALTLKGPSRLSGVEEIVTAPYPGFPTDMQSQIMSLMTVARGQTRIKETIFENRFKTADALIQMGGRISLSDSAARIKGTAQLTGIRTAALDLRGGAALVLAGLCAKGETFIENICHIDRGYDRFEDELCRLGACITREENA